MSRLADLELKKHAHECMLIAGPYVGEFGWEVGVWAPTVRAIANQFAYTIVVSRPSSYALYRDFADEFVPHHARFVGLQDKFNLADTYQGMDLIQAAPTQEDAEAIRSVKRHLEWLRRRSRYKYFIELPPRESIHNHPKRYRSLVPPGTVRDPLKIALAFRVKNDERDWPLSAWYELYVRLKSNGFMPHFVGLPHGVAFPYMIADNRSNSLLETLYAISSSGMIIGGRCGLLVAALQCYTPVLTWGEPDPHLRLKKHWNPFGVPVYYVAETWRPSVERVLDGAMGLFEQLYGKC